MKILQINAIYGYTSTGTIVKSIQQLCAERGHKCNVAYSESLMSVMASGNLYKIGCKFERKIHALLCRINGKQGYFSRIGTFFLLCYMRKWKPDVVHLHMLHGNYINLPMLLKYLAKHDVKTIITLHDCWFYTGGCFHYTFVGCDKWKASCGHCVKKYADTPAYFADKSSEILNDRKKYFGAIRNLIVTGVSDWICSEAIQNVFNGREAITVYNGIDIDIFRPLDMSSVKTESKDLVECIHGLSGCFVIMGLANKWLDPINEEALLYILNKLGNNDRFLIFGCNNNHKDFVRKRYGHYVDRISLYGYTINAQELCILYNVATVFVNCTREESLSLINVESQACGTPIVTYANTGAKETVNGKCSFGVSTGDYMAMWDKIDYIRKLGKSSFSIECRQWVCENFDSKKNYAKYIDLYESL